MRSVRKLWLALHTRADHVVDGRLQIRAWHLFDCSLFGFRIHQIVRSDEPDAIHDHPVSFLAIMIRGGYYEHLIDGVHWRPPGSIMLRPAEVLHRVVLKDGAPSWTINIRGPLQRRWPYQTEEGALDPDKFLSFVIHRTREYDQIRRRQT